MIFANLDCERIMANEYLPKHQKISELSNRAQARLALAAATLSIFDPEGPIWIPFEFDASQLQGLAIEKMGEFITGKIMKKPTVCWSTPHDSRFPGSNWQATASCNDKREFFEWRLEQGLGIPGSKIVSTLEEIEGLAQNTDCESWVVKAPFSTSGSQRMIRYRGQVREEDKSAARKLLARYQTLIFEPFVARSQDFGCLGVVDNTRTSVISVHEMTNDKRGGFAGLSTLLRGKVKLQEEMIREVAHSVGEFLARKDYTGPFSLDGYFSSAGKIFYSEVNARMTLGHVARAWQKELGAAQVWFGFASNTDNDGVVLASDRDHSICVKTR